MKAISPSIELLPVFVAGLGRGTARLNPPALRNTGWNPFGDILGDMEPVEAASGIASTVSSILNCHHMMLWLEQPIRLGRHEFKISAMIDMREGSVTWQGNSTGFSSSADFGTKQREALVSADKHVHAGLAGILGPAREAYLYTYKTAVTAQAALVARRLTAVKRAISQMDKIRAPDLLDAA